MDEAIARTEGRTAADSRYQALLAGMLDPVVTIDDRGTIEHVSRSVETAFGYAPEDLLGRNIAMLMPEPYRSEHDSYLQRYRETGATNILGRTRPFQVVHKNGSLVDVELSVARVDQPGAPGPLFIGSFRDISERVRARRAETSMLRALASLGESTAMLVHEIKNPITAINLALRAVADQLGEDQQEVLGDLVARLRRLEQQLRQSLSFARALELQHQRCTAGVLLADVVQSLQPVLDAEHVSVEVDADPETPPFQADVGRLEEVLTNLVMNAVEALDGGTVWLRARPLGNDRVQLEVSDDGPGIVESVRQSLFKPFVTTKSQGTGLGLPICRRILEEHGGSIEVDDGEGGVGTCFRIELPVHAQGGSPS